LKQNSFFSQTVLHTARLHMRSDIVNNPDIRQVD